LWWFLANCLIFFQLWVFFLKGICDKIFFNFFLFHKMVKVSHKINHWSNPLLNDYAPNGMKSKYQQLYNWDMFHEVPGKWTHLYISEEHPVKIPQIVGPKEFCLFSSLSLTSKANKIQMYSMLKTCQWPCTSTATGIPFQVQHFNVEQRSTVATSTLWCLNHYFVLKIPCQTHNLELF